MYCDEQQSGCVFPTLRVKGLCFYSPVWFWDFGAQPHGAGPVWCGEAPSECRNWYRRHRLTSPSSQGDVPRSRHLSAVLALSDSRCDDISWQLRNRTTLTWTQYESIVFKDRKKWMTGDVLYIAGVGILSGYDNVETTSDGTTVPSDVVKVVIVLWQEL